MIRIAMAEATAKRRPNQAVMEAQMLAQYRRRRPSTGGGRVRRRLRIALLNPGSSRTGGTSVTDTARRSSGSRAPACFGYLARHSSTVALRSWILRRHSSSAFSSLIVPCSSLRPRCRCLTRKEERTTIPTSHAALSVRGTEAHGSHPGAYPESVRFPWCCILPKTSG